MPVIFELGAQSVMLNLTWSNTVLKAPTTSSPSMDTIPVHIQLAAAVQIEGIQTPAI